MISNKIIIPSPGERIEKKKQLAWLLASMAAQSWNSNESIDAMVGNRLIDNAGVAIAAINRAPVCVARSQAMFHKNKNGSTLFGLSSDEKFNCEWAA